MNIAIQPVAESRARAGWIPSWIISSCPFVYFKLSVCLFQAVKIRGKLVTHLGMLESQCHRRPEITQLGTAIVARPVEAIGEHFFLLHQCGYAIGQLNFATCPGPHFFQMMKNSRRENVASNHPKRSRRVL